MRVETILAPRGEGARKASRWVTGIAGRDSTPLLARPFDIAWSGEDLLVADPGAGRVVRIGADGRVSTSKPGAFVSPMGVEVCGQSVVVSDSRRGGVALLSGSLEIERWILEGLERPTGLACADGRLFVVETGRHRLLVVEKERVVRTLGSRGIEAGQFNFPVAIVAAGDSLWVGDTLNFRVLRLDVESGDYVSGFGRLGGAPGEMPRVKGLAFDRENRLWISDAHLDQVALYSRGGTYLMSIGGTGRAAGQFSFPAGIAVHSDGRIAVVDSLNQRVQVFRLVERDEIGAD